MSTHDGSRLVRWIEGFRASRRSRAMQHLSDHMLRDIGLSRDDLRRGPPIHGGR